MRKKLIIELRSDLCAGNGKGFAQVIDIDTAVDAYGIPYVPGRRIKGCMRELAKDVLGEDQDVINRVFGIPGSDRSGSLTVSDARINDYDTQLDRIRRAIDAEEMKPNDITELFCSVRAATALENETVKDNSLRFVRVVNRISPIDQKPLKFYADISYGDDDQECVSRLVKGLRNIGYHRNRGLGSVKCSLENVDVGEALEIPQDEKIDEGTRCVLEYLVYLESDLMLPASDGNHSMDYIPGTSVLGALAGRYIKQYGEDGFGELFLSGQVRFSNLYCSDRDGTEYMPAPSFLAKIKAVENEEGSANHNQKNEEPDNNKGKKKSDIHNQVAEERMCEERRMHGEAAPQYKPLKKGYFNCAKGYKEPETKIVYHNAINTEDGGLYTQYCISAGQYFKGRIEIPGRLCEKLESLFTEKVLFFGRSKTTQYARCRIMDARWNVHKTQRVNLETDKIAAFLCESDIALLHDGRYTVDLEDLRKDLEEAANIRIPADSLNRFTNITSGIVSGYNAKWNLKKPQFPVIKAGSVLLFHVAEPQADLADTYTIGVKQNEGFGRVRLLPDAESIRTLEDPVAKAEQDMSSCKLVEAVKAQRENDRILEEGIKLADKILKASLNSSQIGRLSLMCKESVDYEDYIRRINSIKTDKTKTAALRCFNREKTSDELNKDWKKQQKLFLAALTVSKYELRAGGEKNA